MKKTNTIHERLKVIVDTFAEKKNTVLASVLGTSEANIRNYLKNTPPRSDMLEKIVNIYDVNPEWLLMGVGNMLKEKDCDVTEELSSIGIPLIPIEALAGLAGDDNDGIRYEDCDRYVVPDFEKSGIEFLVKVSGSSMYPKYSSGDVLACKRIKDVLFFQWGKIYVIDSSQGQLVKRVFEHENPDYLLLVSENKENYPPFALPKSDIRSLSIVLGVIRME